jgi:hypothetical protein
LEPTISPFHLQEQLCAIIAALILVAVTLSPILRPWYSKWGATDEEVHRTLPGDDLVPNPRIESTRAITIKATTTAIWPWLVQIGYKRAGWYSYDLLERIVGAGDFVDGRSANRILPELQHLDVGDKVVMHPRILGLSVAAIESGRALVLHTRVDLQTGKSFELSEVMPKKYINSSWTFFVDKLDEKRTRLIVRSRFDYERRCANLVTWRVFTDPISFVMERLMLLGVKQRAESLARSNVKN